MTEQGPVRRYRFGSFEADAGMGELRRQGIRIKLHAQPFRVLCMLLERPGELLTREEISKELWPDGTFVDFDHGVNSTINRIREALGDTASSPRFVETMARRGYRFVAPVERVVAEQMAVAGEEGATPPGERPISGVGFLASPEELPKTPYPVVQTLFVLLQLMYLGFYIGALANLAEIQELLSALPRPGMVMNGLIGTAAILIPVRAFVLCAVVFHAPGVREKFLKLWPALLVLDELWALSPFLLLHHINTGLALACMALLAYAPFVQRSLVLMGAGRANRKASAAAR